MREVSVLIPTYNERENIIPLIERICEVLEERDYEILVIDDNSPDGTARVVETLDNSRLRVFKREGKKGLGSAYKFAFDKAKGKILVQMDADFSHDPSCIQNLLDNIGEGFDVVVGSRYVEKGERNDRLWRRILPSIGNYLFKHLLGIKAKDITSGFRAYRRKVLDRINPSKLPDDFSFQAASLFYFTERGANIGEIPIDFRERRSGETKYSGKELLGNIKLLMDLFFRKHFGRRFLKFCTVGLSGVFVNTAILWSFTEYFGLFYLYSGVIAKEASILSNFILNEHWTWKSIGENNFSGKLRRLLKFNLVSTGGAVINLVLLGFLTSYVGVFYLLSNLIGIGGAVLWNFLVNKKWTWGA